MKTTLLAATLSLFAFAAQAQLEISDANHNLKGYFRKDGTVLDKNQKTLCQFHQGGRITDAQSNVLGYIVNEYEIQDKNHKTQAYIFPDGKVENAKHELIGRIRKDGNGPVVDASDKVIGYITTIEPMWAAAYFFMLKY